MVTVDDVDSSMLDYRLCSCHCWICIIAIVVAIIIFIVCFRWCWNCVWRTKSIGAMIVLA